jgi:hypothetical protein
MRVWGSCHGTQGSVKSEFSAHDQYGRKDTLSSETKKSQQAPTNPGETPRLFAKAVVTPNGVERLCLGAGLIDIGRLGQTIAGL